MNRVSIFALEESFGDYIKKKRIKIAREIEQYTILK